MKAFHLSALLLLSMTTIMACKGQSANPQQKENSKNHITAPVGGRCDGCDLMYVGMPSNIKATDTSAGWHEKGQKFLLTGTVYKVDGKTPAPNTIVYYYHTDNAGYYSPKAGMTEAAKRHGHIRGWIKTDSKGKYAIYTIRPAPYPNEKIVAHIHIFIKEPNINEYYIDELVFDDDKLLTEEKRKAFENRGGSGILKIVKSNDLQIAEHNIILGQNIPGYPG